MAAGDVYNIGPTSIANNAFLDIQPGAAVEVTISSIYCGGAWELYRYDGTNSIGPFASGTTADGLTNLRFRVTNSVRIRVKNVSGGTLYYGADGLVTK